MKIINQISAPISHFFRTFADKASREVSIIINKSGVSRRCNICNNTFRWFGKYKKGTKYQPSFHKMIKMVDSDFDTFSCIYCYAHDRERHLFMYFDKLNFWDFIKKAKILHFAPEKHISEKISIIKPPEYIKGDLYPKDKETEKIDATEIPYDGEHFDLVICNHVLEHIPDYRKAISEIYRVLKFNGVAILQAPYSKLLKSNFEDDGIDSDKLRLFFYGETDHYRIFSETHFFNELQDAGFTLNVVSNNELFDKEEAYYYGVNPNEDLVLVTKE